MTSPKTPFKDLNFGEPMAESITDEDYFYSHYYDHFSLKNRLSKRDFFLILGPKGAGKSAAGKYCKLLLEKERKGELIFEPQELESFPNGLKKLAKAGPERRIEAWKLILALQYFKMAKLDQSNSINNDSEANKLWDNLCQAGLVTDRSQFFTKKTTDIFLEKKLVIKAPRIAKFSQKTRSHNEERNIEIGELSGYIFDLLFGNSSDNQYLLTIDGLDRIITDDGDYWKILESLLVASFAVFNDFRRRDANYHLLVMCRSDIFRRADFPDIDKVNASSVRIEWRNEGREHSTSPLWDYLAKQAEIKVEELLSYFEKTVKVGGGQTVNTFEYLLTATRQTPREVNLLMKRIQNEALSHTKINSKIIKPAVKEFAQNDLLAIIKGETSGMLSTEMPSDAIGTIFGSLKSAEKTTYDDFKEAAKTAGVSRDLLKELIQFFYYAGLIGNYRESTGYIQFYHRNEHIQILKEGPWRVNRGIVDAYNIPWQ
ncbi:P-loop ATPase, Sll1717 family [Schaalia cardiffensis]|uniref:P-loop ATPase, Sll1717 family n=1 Tax=Schaalia cardiffensis TaxID=181487 RepID=UPI0023F0EDF5|nr:hypothetical protein [Schaalia cardiffensis]